MAPTHQLERTPTGWYCPVCQWTWPRGPRGYCPGVRRYAREAVPPALQTQPQLRVAGLQPGGPAQGCYHVGGQAHWRWLYAVADAAPLPARRDAGRAHQYRAWAVQQISRVARQVRTRKDGAYPGI
jgi:hypothetical protein